ncbi:MAG: hypothetical protein ACQEQ7_04060 [Thermodesulfobacteriota bacterium]
MKRAWIFLWVPVGLILLAHSGCGKKAPPFLPENTPLPRVEDLHGEFEDEGVLLTGRVPGVQADSPPITGCVIYHAHYPLEAPPCEGCPVKWVKRKAVQDPVIRQDGFQCEVPEIKTPGVHFFRVRLVGKQGAQGPPSKRVKLRIPD